MCNVHRVYNNIVIQMLINLKQNFKKLNYTILCYKSKYKNKKFL
jgi:hypothetical protein